MTNKQALKLAQKKWGEKGCIQYRPQFKLSYAVGRIVMGILFDTKGQGQSWEEAFQDAKRKIKTR